jgi:hypothetical protein
MKRPHEYAGFASSRAVAGAAPMSAVRLNRAAARR